MGKSTYSKNDLRSMSMNVQHPSGAANIAEQARAGHISSADAAAALREAAAAGSPAAADALLLIDKTTDADT